MSRLSKYSRWFAAPLVAVIACILVFGAFAVESSIGGAGSPDSSWPMFRGSPGLLGVSGSRLPDKLALLWTFKTHGPVKSSPAIVGGRVFVGSNDTNLYALDLQTGKKVWSFKAGDAIESSPLVLSEKVFFGS